MSSISKQFTIGTWTNSNEPLPVELVNFTADVIEKGVMLNWETATEVNNYGFDIEKYIYDETWDKIGFVEGHGNSNSPKQYAFVDETVYGVPKYRLKQIDTDGKFEYSNIIEVENLAIESYNLTQNFPNPFNPTTNINFSIKNHSIVTLKVFDVLGREVDVLVNKEQSVGNYEVEFNASNLTSGIYFYRIQAGEFVETKKMILMK